jgi:hypothetical protein
MHGVKGSVYIKYISTNVSQILEKLGIKDEILPKLKDWMKKVVLPHYTFLVGGNKRADRDNSSVSINAQQINETIKIIINKAIENPKKV